ncbi:MAG: hypothetical protein K6T31_03245, partial [Alicyclobacillus sp.]|nr:hypothetical protein [Alicyclobacillus sp.]
YILTHEHLQIDLSKYKNPEVVIGEQEFADVVQDVQAAQMLGVDMVVDVSVAGSGRNPQALQTIARRTGVRVVAAAGVYWDSDDAAKAVQRYGRNLADKFTEELCKGLDGTDIPAGVLKVGTPKQIGDVERQVFQAVAEASLRTGAPIITHTSLPEQAFWQMDVLEQAGVNLSRVLIGHLDASPNLDIPLAVAERGAKVGIDQIGFNWKTPNEQRVRLVQELIQAGKLQQIILSSDIARRTRLQRYGGTSYSTVLQEFVPLLQAAGVGADNIRQLLTFNPLQLLPWKATAART